ncbi:hypothetical protein GALMADRAFT_238997 [Galerina marginata CBS 339.88]|uniref:DUF6535 domain-containing protein n=1 Tax=Galerina marginata (strain CBS 339.88) TaxID=685588 RepID=A0A067TIW3_GALM3|nr:hypothetical protein GALMADRAFT_238997 [Galerina marginata CBS 339.88]
MSRSRTWKAQREEPLLGEQEQDTKGGQSERPHRTASSRSTRSGARPGNHDPDEEKHEGREHFESPKKWNLDDPFLYAPPKLDRDPWSILLEPLMKKDKRQCDAWKEEVQNLLIFAGLFSAVVTAFIVESYKTLKPDPNDNIISLLSVIANRLDNNTLSTSILPSPVGIRSSFSPTMSAIRINNFWFISLVLSLATVLFGIISLQWIREHQNYPNLPPKESFALFNLRSDGLKRWHIPKIFTTLPLLLQSALILFLAGIVDFLLTFGDDAVAIPVSIVTGLVLLFLIATTVLPALQSILLYLPYLYSRTSKTPPPQCPYKSPQAHAFRAILSSIIRLCVKISTRHNLSRKHGHTYGFKRTNFDIFVLITWTKTTWTEFDMAWLRLRDQFVQRSYHRLSDRYAHNIDHDAPVFDLIQALMATVHSRETDFIPNSLVAQYHCFAEISRWITKRDLLFGEAHPHAVLQANAYFRDIMKDNRIDCNSSLSNFFNFTAYSESWGAADFWPGITRVSKLLHQENMVLFLDELETFRYQDFAGLFEDHMLEVAMRLSTVVHLEEYERYADAAWPNCLSVYHRISFHLGRDSEYDLFFWQWVNNFSVFFQGAARILPPYFPGGTLHAYPDTTKYIDAAACVSLHKTFSSASGLRTAIQGKFVETFQLIVESLEEQMSSPGFCEPSLLFYLTALYLHANQKHDATRHNCLDGLSLTMKAYKEKTIDAGIINRDLEKIYGRQPDLFGDPGDPARFSPDWWDFSKDPNGVDGSILSSRLSMRNAAAAASLFKSDL